MAGLRTLLLFVLLLGASSAHADGGAVLARQHSEGLSATVFAAPVPLRVGPIDVSVLVQKSSDNSMILDAEVLVSLFEAGSPNALWVGAADHEKATNRLFYAAPIVVASPGPWRLLVQVEGRGGRLSMEVALDVLPALPPARRFWFWMAFPFFLVAVFLLHQWLKGRRVRPGAPL